MFTGTNAYSNYGATFSKGGSVIGRCIVQDFPEISTDKIQITNHANGGKREYIPSGLVGLNDITLSLIANTGTVSSIFSEMEAKTISSCVIDDDVDTWTFDGFYLSVKREAADAMSPDVAKLTVVVSPTGDINFS